MSDPIIRVTGLGKKYRIRHQQPDRYRALRDVIADKVRGVFFPRRDSAPQLPEIEDFWALEDISFEVKRGDVVGIVGRNGAGKSTLLKILSRITEPTEGRVELDGSVASLLEVGTGFHPELTGRENIYLNGAILGMPRGEIRRKFDEIVAFAEVEKFLDTPVKRYSSGMYVRLAFAVAAHLEPEILIVDEVLSVGDAEFQRKCLGKMEQVARGGRTVLYVTHNVMSVRNLCNLGILLNRGKLSRFGPVEEVVSEYYSGMRQGMGIDCHRVINLGSSIRLLRLELQPTTLYSGSPTVIKIQIAAIKEDTVLRELAVLIYSMSGIRIAVLDLRHDGVRDLRIGECPLHCEVEIESLPLIEGDYQVGLYVVADDDQNSYLDLTSFSVITPPAQGGIVPYSSQYRGLVDLSFSVRMSAENVAEA